MALPANVKPWEYALQLREKQKAKYTYGVLERQFRKTFEEAARRKGVTGENLIKFWKHVWTMLFSAWVLLLPARLHASWFATNILPLTVKCNIPSYQLKPGDVIGLKEKAAENTSITSQIAVKIPKFSWLDWNETTMKGTFITYPERESVPENIKEQLIVELYSK